MICLAGNSSLLPFVKTVILTVCRANTLFYRSIVLYWYSPYNSTVTKPQVTVRPTSSPFKKALPPAIATVNASGALISSSTTPPSSRISSTNPPPHTAEEVQRLQPSHSTEELNQEMANLEGLMLTLNAITANEFECWNKVGKVKFFFSYMFLLLFIVWCGTNNIDRYYILLVGGSQLLWTINIDLF